MIPASPAHIARAYRATHSAGQEGTLVERHLPLVKSTVDRMRVFLPAALDQEDLYSVGVTGLLAAAKKFDPAQAETFAGFAAMHIRGAVHDELRRMDWMPRSVRDKAKKFKDSLGALEQKLGRPATEEEVCRHLELKPAEYGALLEEIKPATFLPLDAEAFAEESDDISLHEIIADENQANPAEELARQDLVRVVVDRLQELPPMQQKVLALYYFEEMRLSEIAAAFKLTEGRISQIHAQAVLGLRAHLHRTKAE